MTVLKILLGIIAAGGTGAGGTYIAKKFIFSNKKFQNPEEPRAEPLPVTPARQETGG